MTAHILAKYKKVRLYMAKFYKYQNGKQIKMSNRDVKKFIMQQNNWTASEYDKKYDIFKNKLRAYEAFEASRGVAVQKQSPQELLFKQAKAKQRLGASYKPSIQMQRITSFTSISSGRAMQATQGKIYAARRAALYEDATYKAFGKLIERNPIAKDIYTTIQDPVKREKALKAFADKLHTKIDEHGRIEEAEAIPFGEVFGSDAVIDFDISSYI